MAKLTMPGHASFANTPQAILEDSRSDLVNDNVQMMLWS